MCVILDLSEINVVDGVQLNERTFPIWFYHKTVYVGTLGIMANACSFWLYQKTNVIDDVQTYEKRFPFGLIRKRYALRAFGSMNYVFLLALSENRCCR